MWVGNVEGGRETCDIRSAVVLHSVGVGKSLCECVLSGLFSSDTVCNGMDCGALDAARLDWDGMGWDGMGWDGMGRGGVEGGAQV